MHCAEIYAGLGRTAESLALLATLLRQPSGLTVPVLKADPAWDPLRNLPEFEALLANPQHRAEL